MYVCKAGLAEQIGYKNTSTTHSTAELTSSSNFGRVLTDTSVARGEHREIHVLSFLRLSSLSSSFIDSAADFTGVR